MLTAYGETKRLLRNFAGRWQGAGRGQFPTMLPFDYVETLTILEILGKPLFKFEQTALVTTEGRPDHLEIGMIKILDNGEVQFGNIGNGMRAEIMTGAVSENEEGIVIVFNSFAFANDPRMISSRRRLELANDGTLTCSMWMSTNTTQIQEENPHLQAVLKKVSVHKRQSDKFA